MKNKEIKNLELVISNLEDFLKTKTVLQDSKGLCGNLLGYLPNDENRYLGWEYYSGDKIYPVQSNNTAINAETFYRQRIGLYKGKQLEYRLSLARHLIKFFKNKLLQE